MTSVDCIIEVKKDIRIKADLNVPVAFLNDTLYVGEAAISVLLKKETVPVVFRNYDQDNVLEEEEDNEEEDDEEEEYNICHKCAHEQHMAAHHPERIATCPCGLNHPVNNTDIKKATHYVEQAATCACGVDHSLHNNVKNAAQLDNFMRNLKFINSK